MTTKEIFDSTIDALKAANPDRTELHKACAEFGNMLGFEVQRLQHEEREDLEAFVAANKPGWDTHIAARATAREALKPKK